MSRMNLVKGLGTTAGASAASQLFNKGNPEPEVKATPTAKKAVTEEVTSSPATDNKVNPPQKSTNKTGSKKAGNKSGDAGTTDKPSKKSKTPVIHSAAKNDLESIRRVHTTKKKQVPFSIDVEVLEQLDAIEKEYGRGSKSIYINSVLRSAMGLD